MLDTQVAGHSMREKRDIIFWEGVRRELAEVRSHLKMDVAFVSEFAGHARIIRVADAKGSSPVAVGDNIPQDVGYCRKVVEGRLPQLIPDTSLCPDALEIPETRAMPIGAHLSLPIRPHDAGVFGVFCCFNFKPDRSLDARALDSMRPLARRIAAYIEKCAEVDLGLAESLARIEAILASPGPSIVYQPIYALSPFSLNGAEALSRFGGDPARGPDAWFDEAGKIGLRTELELKAIRNAVDGFRPIWRRRPLYLGLNSSPETVLHGDIAGALEGCPTDRIVLEITEHARIEDYRALLKALKPLRDRGVKLAVDDAGAGFASFRHILQLQPEIIKIDACLTRGIHRDMRQQALLRALISFARETNGRIVAEGLETAEEFATVSDLGADAAQGYHLGKPVAAGEFEEALRKSGRVSTHRSRAV